MQKIKNVEKTSFDIFDFRSFLVRHFWLSVFLNSTFLIFIPFLIFCLSNLCRENFPEWRRKYAHFPMKYVDNSKTFKLPLFLRINKMVKFNQCPLYPLTWNIHPLNWFNCCLLNEHDFTAIYEWDSTINSMLYSMFITVWFEATVVFIEVDKCLLIHNPAFSFWTLRHMKKTLKNGILC